MFQGQQKIFIQLLGFLAHLLDEGIPLHRRIILLRISWGNFLSIDAKFENIDRAGIVFGNLRKRAKFTRNMGHKGGLN